METVVHISDDNSDASDEDYTENLMEAEERAEEYDEDKDAIVLSFEIDAEVGEMDDTDQIDYTIFTQNRFCDTAKEKKENELECGTLCTVSKAQITAKASTPVDHSSFLTTEPSCSVRFSSSITNILSLPLDSLHSIASFLTPVEWCGFGQTGKRSNRICRDIIRRVRLHGFRCATEVVTAWKIGEHADAKELAALYIQAGVPLYPQCLGHSYHTILWRMQIESRKMRSTRSSKGNDEDESSPQEAVLDAPFLDPFYVESADFRMHHDYVAQGTYLEDKCNYWIGKEATEAKHQGFPRTPSSSPFTNEGLSTIRRMPQQESTSIPKTPTNIHQHLLDQHYLGRLVVKDQNGAMVTPPVSLSADFFHPAKRRTLASLVRPVSVSVSEGMSGVRVDTHTFGGAEELLDIVQPSSEGLGDVRLLERQPPLSISRLESVLEHTDLHIYTASFDSTTTKNTAGEEYEGMKKHLRSRFGNYQRQLEGFLLRGDNNGFEESILDFWDEFFPHTCNIHYYDRNTVVPRLSRLETFLTKPCPKEFGIVQCEIERIKSNVRGKGMSMKGRLFPTYEYRLFIRDRPHSCSHQESASADEEAFVQRDTVLMVAKNRGRKHLEESGVVPLPTSVKKGSNNFFLYLPQQGDINAHYNMVNPTHLTATTIPNGASHAPLLDSEGCSSVLLGRLQSNFIGTEFQIYTPRSRKPAKHKSPQNFNHAVDFHSEEEPDYDSGMSSDNNTNRRRRFGRRARRRNNAESVGNGNENFSDASSVNSGTYQRSKSCSDISQNRSIRTKRRAIANTCNSLKRSGLYEEEDGAITYTANLLGSRPRIMDVCIPKVSPDGKPGGEWKQYLDSCEDADDCRMLRCFRQVQQNIENHDEQDPAGENINNDGPPPVENENIEDFGLLPLQNRPPWWNVELGSFVLNFGGRVSVASVKNFQLCHRRDQDNIMLQFGRIQGRHSFTMDFQHPLTAVQAFSIAISSLQSKISFG